MTDTYPRMNKINDLAAELIKELKIREASIHAEINYAGVLEYKQDETAPLLARIAELEGKLSKIESIANQNTGNRITEIRAILKKAGGNE